jgi:sec-independent protein translocase protein TatB
MFDIGWSELLVIGVVALIAIGPKELPGVLRSVGQWTGKIRRMASEFQDQFREAMREAEMSDLKKEIDEATGKLSSSFDPLDFKESTEWKPAETPTASADAPPAPPAEAIAADAAVAPPAEPQLPLPEPAPAVTEQDLAPAPAADRSRSA